MYRVTVFIFIISLLLTVALPACAQDSDADGTPDEAELALGMDPRRAEPLALVHDDKSKADGDKLAAAHRLAPDLTTVCFGNIAGDRYVWRVDFADDFVPAGTVFIIYLDADNNPATGRQDGARGCDVMLTCVNGGFDASIRNDDVAVADRKLRGLILGQSLFLSMDLRLKQTPERLSEWKAWLLCHRSEPDNADQDTTVQFSVQGPGESDRPKPKVGAASEYRSQNMRVETPWLGWRTDLRRMGAITLDPKTAQLRGMRRFDRALVPESPNSSAVLRSPKAGVFHVGVVVQDSAAGAEEIELKALGQTIGKLVCLQNDGVFHLFTSTAPVTLKAGSPLELIAAAPMQDFQISEVLLCPKLPVPAPLALTNLAAYCPPQSGDQVSVDVCFTSNLPCTAAVKWGLGQDLSQRSTEEADAGYNHRLRLTGLRRGAQYSVQAVVGRAYGTTQSSVLTFQAQPLRLPRCGVARQSLPLRLSDLLPAPRSNWPVSGGMPLPRGALDDARHCRLLDASGQPCPAQFRELGHWPDGSVKWLLVSLVHGSGDGQYTLEYGSDVSTPAAPEAALQLRESADAVVVTNGRYQTTLSRRAFAPPGVVKLDADGDGTFESPVCASEQGLVLTDAAGNTYRSTGAATDVLTVEEAGPVRVVVLAQGKLAGERGKLMTWRCRLSFYRGFAGIPTVVTLLNDEGKSVSPPTLTSVTSLTLPLTASGAAPRRRWVQEDLDQQRVETPAGADTQNGQGPAWASLGTGAAAVTVALKDFWQLWPKGFTVDGSTLTTELFPQLRPEVYDQYTDPKLLTQHYYWARKGKYQVPMGVALSYDLLFAFGDRPAQEVASAWQTPALLTATPQHYCASGAFADLLPEQSGVFDSFARYVRDGLRQIEETRQRVKEYSWLNYGDWYGERSVNWGNQEYDLQWGLFLQFARSGDLSFFDRGEQAARHTAAVDTIMAAPGPSRVGIQLVHCLGHTGGFGIPRVPGAVYWFESGGYNSGHMWSQGTYTAYCLTGDPRYLDAAEALANWLSGPYLRGFEYYVHRNYGWPTVAVMGGYDVTANPYYLNAARLFTQYVITKQDPGTGVLAHPIGECTHKPLHMGGKVFMSGAVMTGMKMLDRVAPSDELKQALIRNCDWMYHRMWHPRDNSFQYAQCTDFDPSSTHAGTYEACEGLAYAYTLTRNPIYREMLERSLADAMRRGPARIGKEYAMQIRMTPYAVSDLQRWGLKEFPDLPAPEPRVGFDTALYLAEGPGAVVGTAENLTGKPLTVDVRLLAVPDGLQVNATRAQWVVPSTGVTTRGLFEITGTPRAGSVLKLEYELGGRKTQVEIALRVPQPLTFGSALGYVGTPDEPVSKALDKLGLPAARLADLTPATLAGYSALIVGTEAHGKNYLGLRDTPERLLDFILAGGRVALFQLQDSTHRAHHLPYTLAVSDTDGSCRDIIQPRHPLFTAPHPVGSLRGLVSYDTITYADPRWTVLAKDSRNGPAILEATFGKGKILVVQPSPDRYVTGELAPQAGLSADLPAHFMRNVVSWLTAP